MSTFTIQFPGHAPLHCRSMAHSKKMARARPWVAMALLALIPMVSLFAAVWVR